MAVGAYHCHQPVLKPNESIGALFTLVLKRMRWDAGLVEQPIRSFPIACNLNRDTGVPPVRVAWSSGCIDCLYFIAVGTGGTPRIVRHNERAVE